MTHEERLAIAAELARRIVDTYGDAVRAVFITSSTAKGLDREHSDLEIRAVVRDGVEIEREGWLRRRDAVVAESDAQEHTRALQHAATMLIESRDKLRNARLEGDRLDLRVQASWTADAAANLVLLLNGRYMITTRWFYRQAFECPHQPADFRWRIELSVGMVPATEEQIADAAESLTDDLVAMVTARGA